MYIIYLKELYVSSNYALLSHIIAFKNTELLQEMFKRIVLTDHLSLKLYHCGSLVSS